MCSAWGMDHAPGLHVNNKRLTLCGPVERQERGILIAGHEPGQLVAEFVGKAVVEDCGGGERAAPTATLIVEVP